MAPTRVAIIGGGCGGAAAAFWLRAPELGDRFKVTLYTQGWRLGGKGASGRTADPTRRINEHGLHLWMGFYARAFQLMRLVFAEQPSPKPFADLAAAFTPIRDATFMSNDGSGPPPAWSPWPISFPERQGFPGDDLPPFNNLFAAFVGHAKRFIGVHYPLDRERPDFSKAFDTIAAAALNPGLVDPAAAVRKLTSLQGEIEAESFKPLYASPGRLTDVDADRIAMLAGLALAVVIGVATETLLNHLSWEAAVEAMDARDFRDWLKSYGASESARNSAPVRSLYDLGFAYPEGDTSGPGAIAAGVATALVILLIDYQGAPLFQMRSSMGDTIFAPLWHVLVARGVEIKLFHRLQGAIPDIRQTQIEALTFSRQATIRRPPYRPFVSVRDTDCWPDQPNWDQLVDGKALEGKGVNFEDPADSTEDARVTLTRGAKDGFDLVVLAIPPESLKVPTATMTRPRWRNMLAHSASVATQAAQIWLDVTSGSLGWRDPTPVTAYDQPFATWADMSALIGREVWSGKRAARSVHYFCGPLSKSLSEVGNPQQSVVQSFDAWRATALAKLWPRQPNPPVPGVIVGQYWRANTAGSARYVQTPPGSVRWRLEPGARVYDNLYVAGDWTRTRYSGGCVENAVQSGLAAARAISRDPGLGGGQL